MTIEQLLSPAVMMWESNFRKHLNESHITMTDDQISEEFDKWIVENQDVINQSVEDNREHLNEIMSKNREKLNSVNEGMKLNWDDDDDDDDDDEKPGINADEEPEETGPVTGDVEGDGSGTVDPDEPEQRSSLTGAIKLVDDKKSKYSLYGFINDFYDEAEELHTNHDKNSSIMRKLDVSKITNMTALFAFADVPNLDLSSWITSSVKKMEGMFYKSTFNNDSICHLDVSSCADFRNMFLFCPFAFSLNHWTPKFIQKTFRNSDGETETKTVRADLPIIGGTEDEAKIVAKTFRRGMFKQMRAEDEVEESKEIKNIMKHVLDFDTFITEGKFKDFINKGVEKVKGAFKSFAMKLGSFVPFFKETGEVLPVTSAYTAINSIASGEVKGVSVFCDVKNEYLDEKVQSAVDSFVGEPGYYGIVDKDSQEAKNFETFKGMLKEHYEKFGNFGGFESINEDANYSRVGFSAASGGVVARDIDSEDLIEILNDLIVNVPANKGKKHGGAVLIWGAPGIGKSTIPKAVIKAWNKNKGDEFHQKALMVIQCGDLTVDGFSLPIPEMKSIQDYLNERPILKKIIDKLGKSEDTIENVKKNMHRVSIEAPKTWLPAYKMDSTQDEIDVLNEIANGYLDIKEDENGNIVKNETTEGGILLFDEFFRANDQIFKIMMQLILNREYSGYKLGNKWGILCCSNRPKDDDEVDQAFSKTGAVVGTRMLAGAYNFIPSFEDWKKWAVKEGGFDEITLEFLMHDKNNDGEYTNWHTIRPDEYTATGKTAWPTPRTWSALMVEVSNYMENHGYSRITDVPSKKMRRMADGIIGEEMSIKYVSFLQAHASSIAVDAKAVLEDPNYKIPESSKVADVVRQIRSYIELHYSVDEIPDVSYLMNLYNNLNNTYSGAKDNFVKMLHVDLMKMFKVLSKDHKANKKALMEYLQAATDRYEIEKVDIQTD